MVKTRTLDSILHGDLDLSKVDYLKIDVEGAEVEVLKGARKIIQNSPCLKMLVEVEKNNEIEVDVILKELGCDNSVCIAVNPSGTISEKYYFKVEK